MSHDECIALSFLGATGALNLLSVDPVLGSVATDVFGIQGLLPYPDQGVVGAPGLNRNSK